MKSNYPTDIFKDFLEDLVIEKHYKETADKIIFSSESLFTKKISRDLNFILNGRGNSGKNFKKLSITKKKEIVLQVWRYEIK